MHPNDNRYDATAFAGDDFALTIELPNDDIAGRTYDGKVVDAATQTTLASFAVMVDTAAKVVILSLTDAQTTGIPAGKHSYYIRETVGSFTDTLVYGVFYVRGRVL